MSIRIYGFGEAIINYINQVLEDAAKAFQHFVTWSELLQMQCALYTAQGPCVLESRDRRPWWLFYKPFLNWQRLDNFYQKLTKQTVFVTPNMPKQLYIFGAVFSLSLYVGKTHTV